MAAPPGHSGRFFGKVIMDPSATFEPRRDGPRLLQAAIAYNDKLDLLYRLMNPRVRLPAWQVQEILAISPTVFSH